jgi:hypothetical protein
LRGLKHPEIKGVLWCGTCLHFYFETGVTYEIHSGFICNNCHEKERIKRKEKVKRMKFEKYQRLPVDVEAVQYLGETLDCLRYDVRVTWFGSDLEPGTISVKTTEGVETAKFSDYIVRGPMGELEVFKAEIFEAAHDRCGPPCPRPRARKAKEEVTDVFEESK